MSSRAQPVLDEGGGKMSTRTELKLDNYFSRSDIRVIHLRGKEDGSRRPQSWTGLFTVMSAVADTGPADLARVFF